MSAGDSLSKMSVVQLLDLPDELILVILKKVNPQVLLLCSMLDIGNHRLERLAFDKCHSIDLTSHYISTIHHRSLMERFYSHVMPRIIHDIQSLTMNLRDIPSMKAFLENFCNGILPNLTHLKLIVNERHAKTGISIILGTYPISAFTSRKPLCAIGSEYFILPYYGIGEVVRSFCRSSVMVSVQSFELDDNCLLAEILPKDELRLGPSTRLTRVRISLWSFDQCIHLLDQLGSQLHSLTVTIGYISRYVSAVSSEIRSISCPVLKQMKMTIYGNISNYKPCISLLQRLSNVEHLVLLLAIGQGGSTPNDFIGGFVLERDILSYMPHLRQFDFHIRSIVENPSHVSIDHNRQNFVKLQQTFICILDHFKNQYGQCQIYSLPFIGTRLDFISNRFPLFDDNDTFSNVTALLLFDDVKPFENNFFERLARSLPRLKILEIISQLAQQEKTTSTKININFPHLAVLILLDIHIDYVEQFLYRMNLSSLIEFVIDADILLKIIDENDQQARENCSRVGTLTTSKPCYQSIDVIRNFFPLARYVKHGNE